MENLPRIPNSFDITSQSHLYSYQHIHDRNGIHGNDEYHNFEFIEEQRSLFAFQRSNLAIFAMMGIIVVLLLVLLAAMKLEIRCLNQSNRRFILRAIEHRDRAKEELNTEERESYIRSVIQTVVSYCYTPPVDASFRLLDELVLNNIQL